MDHQAAERDGLAGLRRIETVVRVSTVSIAAHVVQDAPGGRRHTRRLGRQQVSIIASRGWFVHQWARGRPNVSFDIQGGQRAGCPDTDIALSVDGVVTD